MRNEIESDPDFITLTERLALLRTMWTAMVDDAAIPPSHRRWAGECLQAWRDVLRLPEQSPEWDDACRRMLTLMRDDPTGPGTILH